MKKIFLFLYTLLVFSGVYAQDVPCKFTHLIFM